MDVDAIIKGLSEAQKRAIMWCPGDGSERVHQKGGEVSFFCLQKVIQGNPQKEIASIYSLTKRGESKTEKRGLWPAATWRLTPLGLAVRARLLEEGK